MASPRKEPCLPYKCPKCPPKHFYGKLYIPWESDAPEKWVCENCGAKLVRSTYETFA